MSSEGNSCVAVESFGLCPFPLWPYTPADWLPYILLIVHLPRRSFPRSFTTTQRSRFSFSALPLILCRLGRRSHSPAVSESALFLPLFASQPLHNRLFPSLDVNPLLKISSRIPHPHFLSSFISFFRNHYLNHVRNACDVQILYLYFNVTRQLAC
jgi:hypothetical protein